MIALPERRSFKHEHVFLSAAVCPCSFMSFKHQHVSLCGLVFRYTHKPQMRSKEHYLTSVLLVRSQKLNLVLPRQRDIFLEWQLMVWQRAERADSRDNGKQMFFKKKVQWVTEFVVLVNHCRACECFWRHFSTTQGAVLTVHVTQTDLWPCYAAPICTVYSSFMCVYVSL